MSGCTKSTRWGEPSGEAAEPSTPPDHEVLLDGFVLEVLHSSARRGRVGTAAADDPDEIIERALQRYLADRELAPPGWACLPLPASELPGEGPPLTVLLRESRHSEACAEAASQGVSLSTLVAHAVMYAWAAEAEGR